MGRKTRDRGPAAGDRRLRLAVTGATGYVGRHVVAELRRRGIDAVLAARSQPSDMDAIQRIDIADNASDSWATLGRPDTLIHLAWGGLPNYKLERHELEELPLQVRFLEGMIGAGVRNLVVAGTCLEYGMQSGALREDMSPAPTTSYGRAKDALRRHLQGLQKSHAFALTWARLFYSWGDFQAASIYGQLRRAAQSGEKTFAMSEGKQERDYLAAGDVAKHLVSLALTGRDNGVVNVCSGKPITVHAQVQRWMKEFGWNLTLDLGRYPYPDYEPMAFWGDTTKLQRCLADSPSP